MLKKVIVAVMLLLAALVASAQTPNVTPQTETFLESAHEVDIRLKGVPSATGTVPTVKLLSAFKAANPNDTSYTLAVPCWNAVSACPPVAGVTVQVFLNLGILGRKNVTAFTGLCGIATECTLPVFTPIQAKPGESYKFWYSRVSAAWKEQPSVVATVVPAPVPVPAPDPTPVPAPAPVAVITAMPNAVSFSYTRGGAAPAPIVVTVVAPGAWSSTDSSPFYDAPTCYSGRGLTCPSGATMTLTPIRLTELPLGTSRSDLTITSGALKLVIPVTVVVQ